MRAVRSDVRRKLYNKLMELRRHNLQQRGWHYDTPRATHFIILYDGVLYYTTIGYDGTRYHSEEVLS